jgi:hypothetical protein
MTAQVKCFEARGDPSKEALSGERFALICAAAASRSTRGEAYIRNVLTELCRWLQSHSVLAAPPPDCAEIDNVQPLVIVLYHLLEERCEFDFDATVVLNRYSPEFCGDDLY